MKFFKCHSQKMKDDKVICLQDKFTDIGPDVFSGFAVEYIILADTTKILRNYAFSGLGKCNIYLPKTIEEIEPLAFENIDVDTTFFCVKGSYADQICTEYGLIINYDTREIFNLVEEQKKLVEEQKQLVAEQQRLVEEQKRIVEEQKRMLEEQRRKEEEEKAKKEAEEKAEAERKKKEAELAEKKKQEQIELEAKNNRKVKVYVYDDKKGERSDFVKYEDLPDEAKLCVADDELFIHCKYINNKESNSFISKKQYYLIFHPESNGDDLSNTSKSMQTVKLFTYDTQNGEKVKVIKMSDFPEQGKKHIVNGEVYIVKKIVDGQIKSFYVPKSEYNKTKNDAVQKTVTQTNVCPFCKKDLLESDMFCPYCGRKVKNIKICNQCGEPNELEDNFCSNCGSKM